MVTDTKNFIDRLDIVTMKKDMLQLKKTGFIAVKEPQKIVLSTPNPQPTFTPPVAPVAPQIKPVLPPEKVAEKIIVPPAVATTPPAIKQDLPKFNPPVTPPMQSAPATQPENFNPIIASKVSAPEKIENPIFATIAQEAPIKDGKVDFRKIITEIQAKSGRTPANKTPNIAPIIPPTPPVQPQIQSQAQVQVKPEPQVQPPTQTLPQIKVEPEKTVTPPPLNENYKKPTEIPSPVMPTPPTPKNTETPSQVVSQKPIQEKEYLKGVTTMVKETLENISVVEKTQRKKFMEEVEEWVKNSTKS